MSVKSKFEELATGLTIPVGKAAKILGVSPSTLKRHAADWGLRTFWDRRGRLYSLSDIKALKDGAAMSMVSDSSTLPFFAIPLFAMDKESQTGYRFRVYRTCPNPGYIGYFGCENHEQISEMILKEHGPGVYFLKLLDEKGNLTSHTFRLEI